ncbi:hypothetical protein GHT06_018898 [Daphnia sinensis]|uniref:RING-type E3 ubiquitin transferase n=1 Tax=Daphnia sinensis TaxID=1820382 RepID=A0AAD5KN49_9CRUS|nr:hypothetical protein GHT06_018898 [Daphnia sinensis]
MANNNQSSTICRKEIVSNYDDDYCAICLGQHVSKSQPDCGHVFCYQCLFDWCKIKLECPSCKTPFSVFYHSMNSPEGWQICIPENPMVSTDGPSGHFVVLNTPRADNDEPEDPEFLRAFEEMLSNPDLQRHNTIAVVSNTLGGDE